MSAREVTVLAYAMATEGRTDAERAELDDFLETPPEERRRRERLAMLETVARMGGRVVRTGGGET